MTEELTLKSRDGLSLEAALDAPEEPRGAVVMCHPHPQMGGTMTAPLVLALRDGLLERGWAVMRFNFRGVGASEGERGTGAAELHDALGALDHARSRFTDAPVALLGWSFGAAVAIRIAASETDVIACVAVAPAISPKPGITEGVPEGVAPEMPVLVVCGSNDNQISPEMCREWAESVPSARYVEVKGANHFFWAKYEQLTEIVAGFLDEVDGATDRQGG